MSTLKTIAVKLSTEMRGRLDELVALANEGHKIRIRQLTDDIIRAAALAQHDKVAKLQSERKVLKKKSKFLALSNFFELALDNGIDKLPTDPVKLYDMVVAKGRVTYGAPLRVVK